MTTKKTIKLKPVLVTTEYRAIFFGYLKEDKNSPAELTLTGARNCIYFTGEGGFLGMASAGPNSNCRIGARVSEIILYKVTSVTPVESEAEKKWEAAPVWK